MLEFLFRKKKLIHMRHIYGSNGFQDGLRMFVRSHSSPKSLKRCAAGNGAFSVQAPDAALSSFSPCLP